MSTQNCDSGKLAEPAVTLGISKLLRIQLIRKFQRIEGNIDCCASAYTRVCKQFECLWRDECLTLVDGDDRRQDGHD